GVEQAFGGELLLELLEGELERAVAVELERFDLQLVFAARFVDVDAAARQHRGAVLRLELQEPGGRPEADAAELGFGVLQCEVVVAAGGELDAGDLTRDPDIEKLLVEDSADGGVKLRDRKDIALGAERQYYLIHFSS